MGKNPTYKSSSPTKNLNGLHRSSSTTFNDSGNVNGFFDDGDEDPLAYDSNESSKTTSKGGKRRKEPWEENGERQDRYHNEMMAMLSWEGWFSLSLLSSVI